MLATPVSFSSVFLLFVGKLFCSLYRSLLAHQRVSNPHLCLLACWSVVMLAAPLTSCAPVTSDF